MVAFSLGSGVVWTIRGPLMEQLIGPLAERLRGPLVERSHQGPPGGASTPGRSPLVDRNICQGPPGRAAVTSVEHENKDTVAKVDGMVPVSSALFCFFLGGGVPIEALVRVLRKAL